MKKGTTGNKKFYTKWQVPTTLPSFTYTGKYQLVEDDNTLIANGESGNTPNDNKVTKPASHQSYTEDWKKLTDGELTVHNLGNVSLGIELFLVDGKSGSGIAIIRNKR